MAFCWETKKCSLSQRLNCSAYLARKNCWEVNDRPCTLDITLCIEFACPVYLLNQERIERAYCDRMVPVYEGGEGELTGSNPN